MLKIHVVSALFWALVGHAFQAAAAEDVPKEAAPSRHAARIAPASQEGEEAIRRFRVPKGFKVELVAAEPLLANPVAFCIDEQGRFYVAETFRLHAGVTDIRGHMSWLDDDLASTSVEDRAAMMNILSTFPNPAIVFSTIGKKLIVVPIAILDSGPSPKNRTYNGKNRIAGIA